MRWFTDKKSFALVFTLPIVALVIFICVALLFISQNDLLLGYRECDSMRAYYVADSGIADGYAKLRSAVGNPPAVAPFNHAYTVGAAGDTGSYAVTVALQAEAGWNTYTITSVGTYHNIAKTLQLQVQLTSFTHWAYLTATENIGNYPPWNGVASYWVTGNIINGPLQVNDHLYVAGNPIFNGPVSVVDNKVTYYDAPGVDHPQFNGGLWLGVMPVPLPDPAPLLTAIKTAAQQPGGILLDSTDNTNPLNPQPGLHSAGTASKITFLANGTMNVTNQARHWNNQNMPIPANGAIYITGGEVDVKGVLNGQASIGCDQNIWTTDSIIYHDTSPGNPNPVSTDVLGLVAKNNVIFPNNLPAGNKEIDAYVVALNGSFYVDNILGLSGVKGTMVQYGGVMAQWSATVFGFFSGDGILAAGYSQIPYYDNRLVNLIPPCFTPAQDVLGLKYRRILFKEL